MGAQHHQGAVEGLPPGALAALQRPVDGYIGLTWQEAEALATSEGRTLRHGFRGRANLVFNRVKVELGEDGRIEHARPG